MQGLIDTHVHLEELGNPKEVLERACQAGVCALVGVGADHPSNQKLLKIIANHQGSPKIYSALGLHPGNLEDSDLDLALQFIEENMDQIVAIGEIGLDFWYKQARREGPERKLQKEVFARQLDLAFQYQKPLIVHSRGAWSECLQIITERKMEKVNFHWYSGPEDVLRDLLKLGYFISATPSAEYSKEHQRAIEVAPLERILLETDSPVTYKPAQGQYRSEPKDVVRTFKAVAKIKGIDEGQVTQQTTENAINFFNLKR